MGNREKKYRINIARTLKSTLDDVLGFENFLVEELSTVETLNQELIFQVRLAFHEAIINVIIHTYKKDSSKDINVEVLVSEGFISVSIRDYGETVDVSRIKSRNLNDLRENGLGVHFYKTLMDKVEYTVPLDQKGNIIKLTKNFEVKK